jgi:copper(I)-binding protein
MYMAIFSGSVMAEVTRGDRQGAISHQVSLDRVWSPETIPGRSNGVVYLDIRNSGDEVVKLTGVSSDNARKAGLHESVLVEGMMKMRSVASLAIPSGGVISLEPGGLHVMLIGLKESLRVGQTHRLVFEFEGGQSLEAEAAVFPMSQLSFPEQ